MGRWWSHIGNKTLGLVGIFEAFAFIRSWEDFQKPKKEYNCSNKSQKKRNFINLVQMAIGNPKKCGQSWNSFFRIGSPTDDLPNELVDEIGQTVTDSSRILPQLLRISRKIS
jgi:hypothetical protein